MLRIHGQKTFPQMVPGLSTPACHCRLLYILSGEDRVEIYINPSITVKIFL